VNNQNNIVQQKLADFFSKYRETTYKKRETIYLEEEAATYIFYIKIGYARFFLTSEEGQEFNVRIYKPTNLLAFIPVFTGIPVVHTYTALTDITGIRAPREQFNDFLKTNQDVFFELTKSYLVSMNSTMTRLEVLLMSSARKRILVVFSFLAEQIGELEGSGITMPIGFTHQELAGFTGLTRETVTIELDGLLKDGLLAQDKKLYKIKDVEKIKELTIP